MEHHRTNEVSYLLVFMLILMGLTACNTNKKPNVVFILTDQWRGSALGYMGDSNIKTPRLNKLAGESISFVNAVSVCPVCTPYRASLMTGKFPTSTGMFFNDLYLPKEELCMAEIFKNNGYQTAYMGKWHLDGHGRLNNVEIERRQGFEYWKGAECSHDYNHMLYYENDLSEEKYWKGYSPFAITREAGKYIDKHKNDDPFLLFISIAAPHFPHHSAPKQYKEMYPLSEIKLPPNVPKEIYDKVLPEIQGYYAHCTAIDHAVGELLDQMKTQGLLENSIVVFTSDHGEMMGSHGRLPGLKQLQWNESVQIPFLMRLPGNDNKSGSINNLPITTPDILPSLLGLCNIPIPETIEGEDLSGLILNHNQPTDRAALFMHPAPFAINAVDSEFRGIRTTDYTFVKLQIGSEMFFDNTKDPFQMNNLIGKPEYKEIQAELEQKLVQELDAIGEEEFRPREYYIEKWGYKLEKNRINHWSFDTGKGIVQSPKHLK